MITVFGAKGGIGKTTISTNLSTALAKNTNSSVAITTAGERFLEIMPRIALALVIGYLSDQLVRATRLVIDNDGKFGPTITSDRGQVTIGTFGVVIDETEFLFDPGIVDMASNIVIERGIAATRRTARLPAITCLFSLHQGHATVEYTRAACRPG